MSLIRIPAYTLQPGDTVGSGETVLGVAAGLRTPRGKVEIILKKKDRVRLAIWNKHTMIMASRIEEKR